MSHQWDCPTKWEAERRGERDQEWGRSRSSNPYEDYYRRDEGCPEAAAAWRDGFRRAEMREEERREEEAAHARAVRRLADADEEAYYYAQQEERTYYAAMDEPVPEDGSN